MSSPRQRISARDYKSGGGRRGGFDINKYQQFGAGLAVGLVVALGVFVFDHRAKPEDTEVVAKPRAAKQTAADDADIEAEDPAEQYAFYDMLKYEVDVPDQARAGRRDLPSVPVEKPGAYVLQVGAFQTEADAERQRQKLVKLGIEATVQRIQIDADVRHRVRIGPLRDLAKLNATRRQLRAADMDAYLLRIGD